MYFCNSKSNNKMKQIKTIFSLTALTLISMSVSMTSCKQKVVETVEDAVTIEVLQNPHLIAIENYLVDSLGKNYTQGEVCIPVYSVINFEEPGEPSNPDEVITATDIKVWGDWWVFNYNIVGDTLKCISGGSHPGMFLLQKDGEAYKVIAFDQVEDGSRNLPSAKRIFGDLYEDFHAINSNQDYRDSVRLAMVAQYVQEHNLSVTMLQDFGWPAVALPLNQ